MLRQFAETAAENILETGAAAVAAAEALWFLALSKLVLAAEELPMAEP